MSESDRNPGNVPLAPVGQGGDALPLDATPTASHHGGPISRLRNYFLTGLILVGPIYITISLTWWFINWVDDLVRPFIPLAYRPETYLPVKIPGLGLMLPLCRMTMRRCQTANSSGRKLIAAGENMLSRIPVVVPTDKRLKPIFWTLFSKGGSSFRCVGVVEFPARRMWSLVFFAN